jgi:hypothetical protein
MESIQNMKDDDEPIITDYDPEEEKRAMLERAKNIDASSALQGQMEKFKELLDESDEDLPKVITNIIQPPTPPRDRQVNEGEFVGTVQATAPDPILFMFSNVKKNTNFKFSIEIIDKIPRPDFIEMMEDSYEVSIIDYLADEFVKKIFSDPEAIKNSIKDEIKSIVYKKKSEKPIRRINTKNTESQ